MSDKIRRWKRDEELSVEELVQRMQAETRGEPAPQFETPEYIEHRTEALRDAGLDEEADESKPKSIEDLTPAEHYERMRSGR
jgi:hypothetical protein